MGYSISVQFKNQNEKEKMQMFLIENQDILNQMQAIDTIQSFFDNTPLSGEQLGYSLNNKNLLGFHSSSIPNYIWNLSAWMSIKANCQSDGENYFYYDDKKMFITFDINNQKNTIVDKDGIPIISKTNKLYLKKITEIFWKNKNSDEIQQHLFFQLNNNFKKYKM